MNTISNGRRPQNIKSGFQKPPIEYLLQLLTLRLGDQTNEETFYGRQPQNIKSGSNLDKKYKIYIDGLQWKTTSKNYNRNISAITNWIFIKF